MCPNGLNNCVYIIHNLRVTEPNYRQTRGFKLILPLCIIGCHDHIIVIASINFDNQFKLRTIEVYHIVENSVLSMEL